MDITDVRIKRVDIRGEKLKGFATVTFDGEFVVSDIKVIEGPNGLFIAMPSRKITDRCAKCGGKNHLRAKFCNDCGAALPPDRVVKDAAGRVKLHVDIAHPINPECRQRVQDAIVRAFTEAGGAAARENAADHASGGGDEDFEREIFA